MRRNGISTRDQLAKTLPVGRSTIYRAFDAEWAGTALPTVLIALKTRFQLSIDRLIEHDEPNPADNHTSNIRKTKKHQPAVRCTPSPVDAPPARS